MNVKISVGVILCLGSILAHLVIRVCLCCLLCLSAFLQDLAKL